MLGNSEIGCVFTVLDNHAVTDDASVNLARDPNVHVSAKDTPTNHSLRAYRPSIHDKTVFQNSALMELARMANDTLVVLTVKE